MAPQEITPETMSSSGCLAEISEMTLDGLYWPILRGRGRRSGTRMREGSNWLVQFRCILSETQESLTAALWYKCRSR